MSEWWKAQCSHVLRHTVIMHCSGVHISGLLSTRTVSLLCGYLQINAYAKQLSPSADAIGRIATPKPLPPPHFRLDQLGPPNSESSSAEVSSPNCGQF